MVTKINKIKENENSNLSKFNFYDEFFNHFIFIRNFFDFLNFLLFFVFCHFLHIDKIISHISVKPICEFFIGEIK